MFVNGIENNMRTIPINSTAHHAGEGWFLSDEFDPWKLPTPVKHLEMSLSAKRDDDTE